MWNLIIGTLGEPFMTGADGETTPGGKLYNAWLQAVLDAEKLCAEKDEDEGKRMPTESDTSTAYFRCWKDDGRAGEGKSGVRSTIGEGENVDADIHDDAARQIAVRFPGHPPWCE
jgi:hypothetical protein